MPKVSFVGNFSVSYSTESHLKWTFENIGWEVIPFQENQVNTQEILNKSMEVDLFLWVHTHSWIIPGRISMKEVINLLRVKGIISAGFHLDRYFGLDFYDQREALIGKHDWWSMDHIFTADGGNDDGFRAKGVNHHWLQPGVVAYGCYKGTQRPEFKCEVGFVGSKAYHPEYPQRTQLVQWLEDTYKSNFKRFGGDTPFGTVREQDLNDVYASIKVVVGDSCFAGANNYWSDRVPETIGRGGFLIHPQTPGLDITGMVGYEAGNYHQLKELIDYYLQAPQERENHIEIGMKDVKENHTYNNRVNQMLEVMGYVGGSS